MPPPPPSGDAPTPRQDPTPSTVFLSSPSDPPPQVVTRILQDLAAGDPGAEARLLEKVYPVLREIAERRLKIELKPGEMEPESLVGEAYMRVFGSVPLEFQNRRHLYGVFGHAMREVLIDEARKRNAKKRTNDRKRVSLEFVGCEALREFDDVIALDSVLTAFEHDHPRASEIVRLKCFVGLKDHQIAEITGISIRSIQRDWSFARDHLREQIDRLAS